METGTTHVCGPYVSAAAVSASSMSSSTVSATAVSAVLRKTVTGCEKQSRYGNQWHP
jgi:hypothetical protein